MSGQEILFEKRGNVAIITFNKEPKLNALNAANYFELAALMNRIAAMPEIHITVITGKGRYFSAGADVTAPRKPADSSQPSAEVEYYLRGFVAQNIYLTHAFYTHPKILCIALNGPAVGLSAAITGFADFVYAQPHSFLLTPFTSLGLVTEGNASIAFVQRLGIAKANEALIQSKRISAEELVQTGYVNKLFNFGRDESDKFLAAVLEEIKERMGDHLNPDSMMKVKALIRAPYKEKMDAQGVAEVFGGMERFLAGIPQEQFAKMASKQKRHKL
ncbi:ClpP/crotonase [Microthyrium microscopicum]|uniref:ClpP/crotonase n=1 Tax=Microthyrium microscopicum TaxID=703497 RepID=A0A6A6TYE6_9PEZI|nr:ClpP/crotonase [Microthyrium microscopicum]